MTVAFEKTGPQITLITLENINCENHHGRSGRFILDNKVYIYIIRRHLKEFKVETSVIHDYMIILSEFLI